MRISSSCQLLFADQSKLCQFNMQPNNFQLSLTPPYAPALMCNKHVAARLLLAKQSTYNQAAHQSTAVSLRHHM
jgi:hypothetical protein